MDDLLGKIFNATTGVWAIFCGIMVALFKAWPAVMGRINERHRDVAGEKSDDWTRLRAEIARLDGRCDHLQKEVDECREREGEWMTRAINAEAKLQGMGEWRNTQATIEAAKRLTSERGGEK